MDKTTVYEKRGSLPVPRFIRKEEAQDCDGCGQPGASRYYMMGINVMNGDVVGLVLCDDLCASLVFLDLISIQKHEPVFFDA